MALDEFTPLRRPLGYKSFHLPVRNRFFSPVLLLWLPCFLMAQEIRYDQVDFQENPPWQSVLAQAQRSGKVIFVDGYTTWCGPCKKMEREVFTQAEVANYFNQKFINVKYDMEGEAGKMLKDRYGVGVFPTYLFIAGNGEVVHRIVGAYLKKGEFLKYSLMAVTPGQSYAALKQRYDNGERNSEFMFDYFLALRLAGEAHQEQEIVEQYLRLMTKDHFMDPTYWGIVQAFLQDPASREFNILLENRKEIGEAIGMPEVDAKIAAILEGYLNGTVETTEAKGQQLIEILRAAELPRRNELLARAMAFQHQRHGDYYDYAFLVDAMLDFRLLDTHPDPLSEFDRHAVLFEKITVDIVLLRKALRWSEYACEHEPQPEKQGAYLQTKARLMRKIGEAGR